LTTGFMDHYFSFTQVLLALFWLTAAIGLQEARLASEADAESAPAPASVPAPDRP
jgi:polysaccharide biosynthesis protein PslJ